MNQPRRRQGRADQHHRRLRPDPFELDEPANKIPEKSNPEANIHRRLDPRYRHERQECGQRRRHRIDAAKKDQRTCRCRAAPGRAADHPCQCRGSGRRGRRAGAAESVSRNVSPKPVAARQAAPEPSLSTTSRSPMNRPEDIFDVPGRSRGRRGRPCRIRPIGRARPPNPVPPRSTLSSPRARRPPARLRRIPSPAARSRRPPAPSAQRPRPEAPAADAKPVAAAMVL